MSEGAEFMAGDRSVVASLVRRGSRAPPPAARGVTAIGLAYSGLLPRGALGVTARRRGWPKGA